MLVTRRLPGIRIAATPPPPVEVLPRMDIAVFVGFAATGPTHRPVAIESVADYARVFGPDAPLAYDADRGERLYAYLGASVRAFFSNGGRRCWVIRVARTREFETLWCKVSGREIQTRECAEANRFALAGVLALSGGGKSLSPAETQARSLGSWSDGLLVQTALTAVGFELKDCLPVTSSPTAGMRFCTTAPLQPGDLIELDDPATSGAARTRRYAIVDTAAARADAGALTWQVQATLCAAFKPCSATLNSPPSLTEEGVAEIGGVIEGRVQAFFESGSELGLDAKISFTLARSSGLVSGHWVKWSDEKQVIWLRIDRLDSTPSREDPDRVDVVVVGQSWRELPQDDLVFPVPTPVRGASLTMDLRVLAGQSEVARLEGVGLTAKSSAAWWVRVSDALYYAPSGGAYGPPTAHLDSDAVARFPLAAIDKELGKNFAWIPLGVNVLFGEALAPRPQMATALERDGLSRFDAELFLDPELAALDVGHLIEQADVIRFLSDTPRELFGIHAALSIGAGGVYNEASLIAVPDALHSGWKVRPAAELPKLTQAEASSPAHWYTHRGPCATNNPAIKLTEPDFGRFLDCDTRKLTTPTWLDLPCDGSCSTLRLTWEGSEPGAVFLLEEALREDFKDARDLYRGLENRFDVGNIREGIFYYRVTAIAGDEYSAASGTLRVAFRSGTWVSWTPAEYDAKNRSVELLRLHRNLLRLASASGELFAVLGLPRHYLAADAIRYASRLRASTRGPGPADPEDFDFNERRALSHGALYHPWIVSPAPRSQVFGMAPAEAQRVYPPDGIATGLLATRASLRGAWIAPANEPFRDVSALTPSIESNAWQALQDAQINLIRADARGFLTLSADTLSDELEWRPISVRRLFILLRRLALLRGSRYVFEPNDDVLRRAVERGFTFLLTDLFRRGAFAGATPAESFMVVTSGTINTGFDRDAGRFFVELCVAPSLPLQFLTIRLSQIGERFTVLEGA